MHAESAQSPSVNGSCGSRSEDRQRCDRTCGCSIVQRNEPSDAMHTPVAEQFATCRFELDPEGRERRTHDPGIVGLAEKAKPDAEPTAQNLSWHRMFETPWAIRPTV